ncbi:type II toxin-antitoxin system RelE/ParE family toxin [Streptomyces sp. A3M-1-3]|uniref:type II toxin-antitoxin system RelE/ParE family toxin n=1 Tax=Streptomyces sp. A3M-1-3 TaxID=2962044 RepID=UPI0027E59F5A|nr:type II toxin-antitoxin system RelE/ParE family toxin [Streptomyces sp. A3M-1-3]
MEHEVRLWLETLSAQHYRQAEEKAELLAAYPTTLGEPHSRNLGDGVPELRFSPDGNAIRVTYWLAPGWLLENGSFCSTSSESRRCARTRRSSVPSRSGCIVKRRMVPRTECSPAMSRRSCEPRTLEAGSRKEDHRGVGTCCLVRPLL